MAEGLRSAPDNTLRVIAIVGGIILAVWLLGDIVLAILMAALIAVILRGLVEAAVRLTKAPEAVMLALIVLLILAALVGLAYYLGPRLVTQVQQLSDRLSDEYSALQAQYGQTAVGRLVFNQLSGGGALAADLKGYAGKLATSTLGGIVTGFVLVVTSLYFAIAPHTYLGGVLRLFPLPYRPRAAKVLRDIGYTLRWWSLGQLIDMLTVGILSGVGLSLLAVPLPFALATLAGLLTFIPYFGAIIAAVPAIMLAITVSWKTAIWVVVVFLICHGIEGYVVAPLVQRRTAHLPPAVLILSMTILGTLFGPLGVIVGSPAAAVLLVIVRDVYVGDILHDPAVEPGAKSP